MTVYYINQALILGLAYPLCIRKPNKMKMMSYLIICFGYMWFLATFRVNIGYDYLSYIKIFEGIGSTYNFIDLFSLPYEPGFTLLTWLMTLVVSSPTVMYGVYSALIFVPIAVGIYWYVKPSEAWLSTWCYVALTYFYSSMNFIRQNLALGLVFLSYRFLRSRKPIPYFLLVLLASCFHRTALIMIPVYFLATIPLNKISGSIYAGATLLLYLFSPWIMDFITSYVFSYYKDTVYVDTGFSFVFLFIPTVILVLCLSVYIIWIKRNRDAVILMNVMIYSWIIWLFITRHFILERFSHFTYILALVAVPAALSCLFAPDEDYAALSKLAAEKPTKKTKQDLHKEKSIQQKISDHKKYYWSAVIAFMIVSWLYNEFGQYVNNFHNVFPYQTSLNGSKTSFSNEYFVSLEDKQAYKQRENELFEYLKNMNNENYVYILAIKDEGTVGLTPKLVKALHSLGLQADFKNARNSSYIAVIQNRAIAHEEISDNQLEYQLSVNNANISISSASYYVGNHASVRINDVECAVNARGLNIVVYDATKGTVVETKAFDTYEGLYAYSLDPAMNSSM